MNNLPATPIQDRRSEEAKNATLSTHRPNPLTSLLPPEAWPLTPVPFLLACFIILSLPSSAQDSATITIEAKSDSKAQPRIYSVVARTNVTVESERIRHNAKLQFSTLRGTEGPFRLELIGDAEVVEVKGEGLRSWAILRKENRRYLEIAVGGETAEIEVEVTMRSPRFELPADHELAHFGKGEAASFSGEIRIAFARGVTGKVRTSEEFASLQSSGGDSVYHTASGGRIDIRVERDISQPPPVNLDKVRLSGAVDFDSDTIVWSLSGTATVTEADASIAILSGQAALTKSPEVDAGYRVRLAKGNPLATLAATDRDTKHDERSTTNQNYELLFAETGTFPVELEFASRIEGTEDGGYSIQFVVGGEGVIPIDLSGVGEDSEFSKGNLVFSDGSWNGFVPPSGRVALGWKPMAATGDGKLFFSTSGMIETRIGTGLLRQSHEITFRILQGKIRILQFRLVGEGEVVSVAGNNLLAWKVEDDVLSIELNEDMEEEGVVAIGTQRGLDNLPVTLRPLRVEPLESIRHSGFIRLANQGSVRVDPADLNGLTQLSPDKFPREGIEARQQFIFRFPSSTYGFELTCSRIEPEVHVSEVSRYRLSESDRTLNSSVELDIRDAPIREWDIQVPADYSVVSVTGADITDYILAREAVDGKRNLKVIFGKEVSGRKLIQLFLEENITAESGEWNLPSLAYPEAESVRGDLGVAAAPGFRIGIDETTSLAERPLSAFPGEGAQLQHYFRLRETEWRAGMTIEILERNIQADVFHLYSLGDGSVRGSVLLNYFITGAPANQFELQIPEGLENVLAEGKDIRGQRLADGVLTVSLHQAVMGSFTLLVTFEQEAGETLSPGGVVPQGIEVESGFVQLVSPNQVILDEVEVSESLLRLDQLELPPEFRLLSASPSLGIWQYNERPFSLVVDLDWLEPDRTLDQVVEFAEAVTLVSGDSESVTDLFYYVKSRDNRPFAIRLPDGARIWDVSANGRKVAPRLNGEVTQIPLLMTRDKGPFTEIRMRLGNPIEQGKIELPVVKVPVLKTGWQFKSESNQLIELKKDRFLAENPVRAPTGLQWLQSNGLTVLGIIILCVALGGFLHSRKKRIRWAAIPLWLIAGFFSCAAAVAAWDERSRPSPLMIHLPVLSAEEPVSVEVQTRPAREMEFSGRGLTLGIAGLIGIMAGLIIGTGRSSGRGAFGGGLALMSLGLLDFANGAYLFFGFLALVILGFLLIPLILGWIMRPARTGATAALILMGTGLAMGEVDDVSCRGWDSLEETWSVQHDTGRLEVSVEGTLTGSGGDRFLLLQSPAVLMEVDAGDLIVKKQARDETIEYLIVIPSSDDPFELDGNVTRRVAFSYLVETADLRKGVEVPSGLASIHRITAVSDEAGWEFRVPGAARVVRDGESTTVHLVPSSKHTVFLQPLERDPSREATRYFVESEQLYLPSPGVVDGAHRFEVLPSQGLVRQLRFKIPSGFTVSSVEGPVGTWQFDPEKESMAVEIDPPQAGRFQVFVETQRGLDPLPVSTMLIPMTEEEAEGQTGLLGLAFRGDAKPEKVVASDLGTVNPDDFGAELTARSGAVLNRVFRFKGQTGALEVSLTEVEPEIRVTSREVISLGDENLLFNINFAAEISRAGIFQLSFSVPESLEVNSISGEGLQHWSDSVEEGFRTITLHLVEKTLGRREFNVSLNAPPPPADQPWQLPNFSVIEANRQSGELIIQPATGIRLSSGERQNVSELDPRQLGAREKGALAFRLLQKDWAITLDIDNLAPRVTGEILHDLTIREARVQTAITGKLKVENAAIRSLRVRLPVSDEETIRTVRINGAAVRGIARVEDGNEEGLWEIQLKRWLIGDLSFQIFWEERNTPGEGSFSRTPISFPDVRQLRYYSAVRPGGRLEGSLAEAESTTWRRIDWKSVPGPLRDVGNRIAPSLAFKARSTPGDLVLELSRHTLADALKLRMTSGRFRTVLSPYGTRLTKVDVDLEVIQRSHLTLTLPSGSELFCLFVNGEPVEPVKSVSPLPTAFYKLPPIQWQFPVLPDAKGRVARVMAIYLEPGEIRGKVEMLAPRFDIPMEGVTWDVYSPSQLTLSSHRGNLIYIDHQQMQNLDRTSYLAAAEQRRKEQSVEAENLLEQANELLRSGQQTLARQAFQNVANRSGLDAASNEDARVQLENLQTQQALVGLNTRRQRMYLDRNVEDGLDPAKDQLRQSATKNPVLQMGEVNFRPDDLSELLQGNTTDELNAFRRIATRMVEQQQSGETQVPGLDLAPPEEGNRYRFERGVQVANDAPLYLEVKFATESEADRWKWMVAIGMVLLMAAVVAGGGVRREEF